MDIDDRMVGRILTRREVLALLGSAGAALLIGCSTGDDDETPTSTTSNSATTATATSGSVATSSTDAGAATAPAAGSTSTSTAIDTTVLPACIVSPELTEGPYYVDVDLDRADIRSDPATGAVVEGTPLQLVLRTLQGRRFVEFHELFDTTRGPQVMVVTFIAMLELAKETLIELTQAEAFAPIYVRLAYTPAS